MATQMMTTRDDYQAELGRRLRAVRQQQDLTLQQVEERSTGKWKAVVIGAYERGDRAISAAKLADLADFYGVPVSEVLPPTEPVVPVEDPGAGPRIVLDLTRLEENDDPAISAVARWAHAVQRQRGDYNGRVLTLRREDLRTLSVIAGMGTDDFVEQLSARGVLRNG
jgi:transcriptional regulator with XRE-family HTH domain